VVITYTDGNSSTSYSVGMMGATGATGAAGAAGPQGPTGATGAQGPEGEQGFSGVMPVEWGVVAETALVDGSEGTNSWVGINEEILINLPNIPAENCDYYTVVVSRTLKEGDDESFLFCCADLSSTHGSNAVLRVLFFSVQDMEFRWCNFSFAVYPLPPVM
jgi:hypothetical protein